MLRRFIGTPHPLGSSHADSPAPAAGGSVRLPILGWAQVGLLAAAGSVLVCVTSEPVATREGSRPWTSTVPHPGGVQAVALAPDGLRLATGGEVGPVVIWEVGRGAEQQLGKDSAGAVCSLAFSPDGATLAAGDCESTVTLWDLATGQERIRLRAGSGCINRLAFTSDGATLAAGGGESAIRLWDLRSRSVRATLLGHRLSVCALAFAPDGRTLASGCTEGRVKLWDVAGHRCRERPGERIHPGSVFCLAFSPDGSLLASGLNNGLELREVATDRVLTRPGTGPTAAQGVSFSADGRMLISARATGLIQFWSLGELRELASLRMDSGSRCLAWSRDGRCVAWGDLEHQVHVWDLAPWLGGPRGRVQEERPGPLDRLSVGQPHAAVRAQ
jgi:WD40 repeat protein